MVCKTVYGGSNPPGTSEESLEVVCNERFELFLFCPFVTLAGLSGGSLFSWLPLAGSLGGFVVFLLRYSSSNGCCMIVHHPLHDHVTVGGDHATMVDNECLRRKA